jgi:hypothetical protein
MTFKSIATALVLTVLSGVASAGVLSDGSYEGKGLWKSPSARGNYDVATVVKGDSIQARYTFGNGLTRSWNLKMIAQEKGFFTVETEGKTIGHGYCLESSQVCHYEVKFDKLTLEETLTNIGDKLYRFGSKDDGQGRIVWQEMYDRSPGNTATAN